MSQTQSSATRHEIRPTPVAALCGGGRAIWNTCAPTDGLAGLHLRQIAQDRDGFIWSATLNRGISRFDGESDRLASLTGVEEPIYIEKSPSSKQ